MPANSKVVNFSLLLFLSIIFGLCTLSVATPIAESDVTELLSKPGLHLPGLLEPIGRRQVGTSCGPVTGANVSGACLNADSTCCNGFYTVGFCPGGSNIRCCTVIQHCSGGNGFCNDINHVSCSVPYISGLCPGPADVRCCRGVNGGSFCTPGGP